MRFEHFALNVADPVAVATWYVANCGLNVVRSIDKAPFTHFLADEKGQVVAELYFNPAAPVPDYGSHHPLEFHVAFMVPNAEEAKGRLLSAGAVFVEEVRPDAASLLVMLRDPFGIPLQICQRSKPMM
jgi:glyoxylase I family protein